MPVIGIPVDMLLERVETKLDRDQLVEHLQHLGCDVEGYATLTRFRCQRCDNIMEITETENPPVLCDRCAADYREDEALRIELGTSDVIRMELLAVRPDMFDPGGLARMLRRYLREGKRPEYQLEKAQYCVDVDPALADEKSFRPRIACAVVRGITLDDDIIKVIMKLQENLHWALGRDRKHASIGVYDLDTLKGKNFKYRAVGKEELKFTPLGFDVNDPAAQMTPQKILEEHPKGMAYARLLANFDRYPLLEDEDAHVLSMPPIINSENTRVRQQTKNFFIDVTGSEDRIVQKALNILVTSLVELDKDATIEQVEIQYAKEKLLTPNLDDQRMSFKATEPQRLIGVELRKDDVKELLLAMGHRIIDEKDQLLEVGIPAYRNDIMHSIDLVEDVAIAYGYRNIVTSLVPTLTVGAPQPQEEMNNHLRRALTGLGYFEVMTLILSSENAQFDAMALPKADDGVLIENPISVEQTMIRMSMLPGILDTFAVNTDHEMPQYIFELGNISHFDPSTETGAQEKPRIAGGAIGPKVDYSEIRATAEAVLRELGWDIEIEAVDRGSFIPGRSAKIFAKKGDERKAVGYMGEVHPQVLENFKLIQPTALFEIALDSL